ncbi:nicotinate-nucleotide--dimethylbenzimidazole phosphoribosyltransferase [Acetobacter oeni]|nr:nicotinate-nucleotide--dimethylbenzimidazole phosphoribosyltransferase [Acetobacter oeni]
MTRSPFPDPEALRRACLSPRPADEDAARAVSERDAQLTKPAGSLGRLEELVAWLAHWQHRAPPTLEHVQCLVFAGNHGVVAQGVSAWPAEVTGLMTHNFRNGGAAINQLAQNAQARLDVIELEDLRPTGDFTKEPAMTPDTFLRIVNTGFSAVDPQADLVCLGEMGIGNTTTASALAAALFGGNTSCWVGPGAGSDAAGMERKIAALGAGLAYHYSTMAEPLEIARCLGGHELAAIMGAILAARKHGIPVLLDGFVCTAAAAPLFRLHPDGLAHCRIAHSSAEPGHARLAAALGQAPLLDFGLRLGEASGAALAVPLLRGALACHTGMHSFAEAGIGI